MLENEESQSAIPVVDIVRTSWNKIGAIYTQNRNGRKMDRELHRFKQLLPKNAKVLDVGSGAGVPVAHFLTKNEFKVTGIDISETMLLLARENVPDATYIQMDMQKLEFPTNIFDGIICVYAIFHTPRKNHRNILLKFFNILKPGGFLLINTGINGTEGSSTFFEAPMFWSSYEPEDTSKLVTSVGFSILSNEILSRGGEMQFWVFAKKPEYIEN